jgi:hypothetical protein
MKKNKWKKLGAFLFYLKEWGWIIFWIAMGFVELVVGLIEWNLLCVVLSNIFFINATLELQDKRLETLGEWNKANSECLLDLIKALNKVK